MSECLKTYLLAKKNNNIQKRMLKTKNKPAERNINYKYTESISYNLIENMTMFKNNEINKSELNLRLLSNLSLFISKGELDKKKIKKNKKSNNIDNNKKCSMDNYGIYFPTKRITCLEEIKLNNINSIVNQKKHKKDNLKIPFMHEHIKVFFPLGRNFINFDFQYKNKTSSKSNDSLFNMMNKEKNAKDESFYNESENSISLISEESKNMSNKDLTNIIDNKNFLDSNNKIIFKNLKRFKKYNQLVDYIECPLINKESTKEKYNNFIKLLDRVDNLFEDNEINNINYINNNDINNNIYLNDENDNKIFMDNYQIINSLKNLNNINIEQTKNKNYIASTIIEDKKNKSVNVSNNNDILFLNSSLKNDLSETLDKTSSSMNRNKSQIINSKNNNQEISPSLKKKYLKRMNENYINLVHKIYMNFMSKCLLARSYFFNDTMIKKLFVQLYKKSLLKLGIDNKKIYEKILKTQIFNNKLLSFDQFIQSFDIIIYDNEYENLKEKFSFLLSIVSYDDDNENSFLNSKKIEIFFDLLGCSAIYILDFCESLGEKLVVRFNAVYKKDEENNILLGKYRLRKMKIILDSFFDELQIDI